VKMKRGDLYVDLSKVSKGSLPLVPVLVEIMCTYLDHRTTAGADGGDMFGGFTALPLM